MVVGESPGREEVVYGRPFVGPSGRLLDRLFAAVGLDRTRVWVTNATLGAAPPSARTAKPQTFSTRFPNAVYSCLPRLEAEIATARPRVIVTFGRTAFQALANAELHHTRLVDNPCNNPRCRPSDRKVGPVIACAVGDCDWFELAPAELAESEFRTLVDERGEGVTVTDADYAERVKAWGAEVKAKHGSRCPKCNAKIGQLRPKRMKCGDCGGKKKRQEAYTTFPDEYPLIGRDGCAGAVFRAEDLPSRLDEFGVRFVIPTYHPSFLMRPPPKGAMGGQFAAPAVCEALAKAKRLLTEEPRWKDPTPKVVHHTDIATIREWLAKPGRYAVDLESNSFDGPVPFVDPDADEGVGGVTGVAVIGFARLDRDEVLVVDTRGLRGREGAFQDLLGKFFARQDVETVFQNGSYDRLVCWYVWGVWCANQRGETLLAHNDLEPDASHDLGFQAHELLDAPHWKGNGRKLRPGEKDENSGYTDFAELALYNARDCKNTIELDTIYRGAPGSKGRLHVERVAQVYETDLTSHELAIRMTINGMPLKRPLLQRARAELVQKRDGYLQAMRELTTPDFVPTGKQLLNTLFDPHGPCNLPVLATTAKGAPSADKPALKRLVTLHPLPQLILDFRAVDYLISHYIDSSGIRWGLDGRLHPSWKPVLVTGRWSTNPNVQNWPQVMRRAFEADPGRMLVGADYAQLELRIMADLSADPRLIELILNADESDKLNPDKDPHSYLAARVFGRSFLEGSKDERKLLRDITKRIWYGSLYGAGADTIVTSIADSDYSGPPVQKTLVEQVLAAIVREFPGVQRWRTQQVRNLYQTSEVRTPGLGRRRPFPLGEVEATVGYNYPIQGTGGDIVNWRLAVLADALPDVDPTAFIFAQVHDAAYVECDEDKTDEVKALVQDILTIEHSFGGGQKMRYEATAKADKNWGVIS
jgi:DNA polymerase I-like protein with 3'-5' exonuclease and polymerase domains